MAGRNSSRKGRQVCVLTTVDPMNIPMLTPRFEENEPRMIPPRMKWRTVCRIQKNWFDLRIAQDKGSEFDQSQSDAILLKNIMPAESMVKVVTRK